jgi:hypothetical protein
VTVSFDIVSRQFRNRPGTGAIICGLPAVLLLSTLGCARPLGNFARFDPAMRADREVNVRLMLSYDENSDGIVTQQERESDLKRQFEAVDANKDGVVDANEMGAENTRRFRATGTSASPLIDWNHDGHISFEEFATTARSAFDTLDADRNGVLSCQELVLTPMGIGPIGLARRGAGSMGPGRSGRGPGRDGRGPGGGGYPGR